MNYVDAVNSGLARTGAIKLHGPEAFEGMRAAGRLAAETLDFITPYVKPGITTEQLDKLCHDFIISHNAVPAPHTGPKVKPIHMKTPK